MNDEPKQLTSPWRKSQAANQVIQSTWSDCDSYNKREKSGIGLLTKHSFIVMVETWNADRHGRWPDGGLFRLHCLLRRLHALLVVLLSKAHVPQELRVHLQQRKETVKWAGGTQGGGDAQFQDLLGKLNNQTTSKTIEQKTNGPMVKKKRKSNDLLGGIWFHIWVVVI